VGLGNIKSMNISNVASKYGTRMEEERFNGEVLLKKSIAQGEKVLSILGNGKGYMEGCKG